MEIPVIDQMSYYQRKLAFEMDSSDLFAALAAGEPLVVVDGRSSKAYEQEHIPGAISLPHRESVSTRLSLSTSQKLTYAIATGSAAMPRRRRRSSC
jgi:rhodanese-related sulfurtransferase